VAEYDVVIRGGTVVDGTGTPGYRADVAVNGGLIEHVGDVSGRGEREFDADGLVVAPGWVDIHTHYDGQLLWDPFLSGSTTQGVTTVVTGNCGLGFAPARESNREFLIRLMEGIEGIPSDVLQAGIDWKWRSFDEYISVLDQLTFASDIAVQVPHAALRTFVMGENGHVDGVAPTQAEIDEMGNEAVRAIRAGAVGFTTSRLPQHLSSDGRVTPTHGAPLEELIGIASALGAIDRGVVQMALDMNYPTEAFGLAQSVAEASHRPTSFLLTQPLGSGVDGHLEQLAWLESAVAKGLVIAGQVATRPPGTLLTLDGGKHPLMNSRSYQSIATLPLTQRVDELKRPSMRREILHELAAEEGERRVLRKYAYSFPMREPGRYDFRPEESLSAIAARERRTPEDVAYDILLEREARGLIFAPGANFEAPNLDATFEMLAHPNTLPSLSDGGAHCTQVADMSYATFVLTRWVRDAEDGRRVSLEWAVKRLAADTAEWVGLTDRGVIGSGRRADINIIDMEALSVALPELVADLPLGGRRFVQEARGYCATLVSGVVVSEEGRYTGQLPGRLARATAAVQ
jgi:N-acyl-D-aspartate/D-glutamate deacylase